MRKIERMHSTFSFSAQRWLQQQQQCYCSQYYFKFRLGEERLHKQIAVLSEKEPALEADSRRRESGHRRVLQGDESAQDQEVVFSTFISYVSNFISKII